jgi:hypothetical protein
MTLLKSRKENNMDSKKLEEIINRISAGGRGLARGVTGDLLKYPMAGVLTGIGKLKGGDGTYDEALAALEKGSASDKKNYPTETGIGTGIGAAIGGGKAIQLAKRLGTGAEAARELASDVPTPTSKKPYDRLPGDAGDVYERSWRRSEKDKASEKQFAGEKERLDAKASAKPLRKDTAQQSSPEKIDRVLGAKDKAVSDMAAEAKAKQAAARESTDPEFMSNPNWTQKMQEVSDQVGKDANELGSNMRNYQRKKIDEELDGPTDKWWDEIDSYNKTGSPLKQGEATGKERFVREPEATAPRPAMDLPSGQVQERTIPGKSIYKEGANDMPKSVSAYDLPSKDKWWEKDDAMAMADSNTKRKSYEEGGADELFNELRQTPPSQVLKAERDGPNGLDEQIVTIKVNGLKSEKGQAALARLDEIAKKHGYTRFQDIADKFKAQK